MKTIKMTLATVVMMLAVATGNAQTIFVKLLLAENSNDLTQYHSPIVLAFDSNGADSLQFPDAGNESFFGQFNAKMFPFTTSADGFVISNYDARPALTSIKSIPFGIVSKDTGTVKIIAMVSSSDQSTPPPACTVWIENTVTGERHSLLDTVKLDVSTNTNYATDYIVHIGLPCSNVSTDEICYGMNNGSLHVTGPNFPGFTHELTLNGAPLYTAVVSGIDTLVNNLAPGNYISVVRINGIPFDSSDITINAASQLIADFASDYNFILAGETVNFTDNSIGAVNYEWSFGDGDSSTTAGNESHLFATPGTFTVTLNVTDNNGCTANTFDIIEVDTAASTSSHNNSFGGGHGSFFSSGSGNGLSASTSCVAGVGAHVTLFNQKVLVDLGEGSAQTVSIVSANGTVVSNAPQFNSATEYVLPASGLYIVTIVYTNGTSNSTTILAQ